MRVAAGRFIVAQSWTNNRLASRSSLGLFVLVYLVWLVWLGQYPFQLSSDDAFNFSRAVERFSVLEFRPHFPGYPAFVAVCKMMAMLVGKELANVWVSFGAALLLPVLVVCLVSQRIYAYQQASPVFPVVFAATLLLIQPLLASIALSGLSDSLGMVFLMLAIIFSFKKRYLFSGVMLGLMLATRPSYFPLVMGFIAIPWLLKSERSISKHYFKAMLGVTLVGVISFLYIWAKDGLAYIDEGIRFTEGHFAIWGNTKSSDDLQIVQWWDSLYSNYGFIGLALMVCSFLCALIGWRSKQNKTNDQRAIALIALGYLVWMLMAQNPDNLRHFSPVMMLFSVLISLQLSQLVEAAQRAMFATLASLLILAYFTIASWQNINFNVLSSPTQQAVAWINGQNNIQHIGTNYSVNLLRKQLTNSAVYDMYYPSSNLALKNNNAWRLTGTPLNNWSLIKRFPARFAGERDLYLYKISQ